MRCYACERQDTSTCTRCGKSYCPDHGADLCAVCLDPVVAAPSSGSFRVALLGLFAASVVALWLLVRPPGVPGDSTGVVQQPDGTPGFTPALTPDSDDETPAPTDGVTSPTPTSDVTDAPATATPTPLAETPSPTPEPTPEPTAAPVEYVVQSGDTWFGIAEAYGVDAATLASFNGYTLEDVLPVGVTLVIPQ